MKIRPYEILPFVFPAMSIILVIILAFRWYKLRDEMIDSSDYVPIEERRPSEPSLAPCSDYGNFKINDVPARCYKYFKGEE